MQKYEKKLICWRKLQKKNFSYPSLVFLIPISYPYHR